MILAEYIWELVGLLYYAAFLVMSRGKNAARLSKRTKVLMLVTAIVMVASAPLHYADRKLGVTLMVLLAVASVISNFADAAVSRRSIPPAGSRRGR